jgi:hypothetical protein
MTNCVATSQCRDRYSHRRIGRQAADRNYDDVVKKQAQAHMVCIDSIELKHAM